MWDIHFLNTPHRSLSAFGLFDTHSVILIENKMDVKLLPSYHSKLGILPRVAEIIYISYHSNMLCHLLVLPLVALCHKMMCQLSFPYKKF
jgi:hypothetical protein